MSGFTQSQLDQIRTQLIASMGQPRSITVDGETFTQHSLSELLAAYQLATVSVVRPNNGLVYQRIVPPGAGR